VPSKTNTATERYLSDKEIAERWGCSATLVRRARYSGDLPTTRFGGVARVALSAVLAYEAARTEGAEA
jgi:hypothetical protein